MVSAGSTEAAGLVSDREASRWYTRHQYTPSSATWCHHGAPNALGGDVDGRHSLLSRKGGVPDGRLPLVCEKVGKMLYCLEFQEVLRGCAPSPSESL